MRKIMKCLPVFLIFILLMSMVSAQLFPMFVSGEIKFGDRSYANHKVTIESLELDYRWETYTDGYGRYYVTFNNLKTDLEEKVYSGDVVYIYACPIEVDPACRKKVVVSTNPQIVDFALGEGYQDPGSIRTDEVCGDCICPSCPSCPECPKVVCPTCEVCPEFPEDEGNSLWFLLATLFIGAGGGLAYGGYFIKRKEAMGKGIGLKIYTKLNGSEGVLHKHPGIVGYHDPITSHRAVIERHPKGELTPKYEKNVDGVWEYIG